MEDECLYDMGNFHNDTQLLLRKKTTAEEIRNSRESCRQKSIKKIYPDSAALFMEFSDKMAFLWLFLEESALAVVKQDLLNIW